MEWFELLIVLGLCHWLADFGLQSDTMAIRKNWRNDEKMEKEWIKKNPDRPYQSKWIYYLTGHAWIHGAVIYLFTGILWITIVEIFVHFLVDMLKISGFTQIHQDQLIHLMSKLCYVFIFLMMKGV